ncbi:MAG: alpha/beta hydrolase [Acidobacteria bacterium]|nr:alpha/beta hydrolase [Acidobacteriota bacterium]
MSTGERFVDASFEPAVCGFLHGGARRAGLVLTHGAGGNAQGGLLLALGECFSAAEFAVLRAELPFRQLRPHGPPRPRDGALDRAGLKNAVAMIRKLTSGPVFLGGQSYGGRQASMLLAEESVADGLLLLSYPLHAPSHPDRLRTDHLPSIQVPTLFVHGTRDPFGSIQELEKAQKLIPARTSLMIVEGAGHDLGFKGKAKRAELPEMVLSRFREFFAVTP